VSQRRMPSGQGPARGGGRSNSAGSGAAAGARPSSRAAIARRSAERTAREVTRSPGRAAVPEPVGRAEHRAGPRTGVRRAAGPARRTKAPRPPRRLSGRAAVLGLLLLALTLAYAYPLRVYLAQQGEIDQTEQAQLDQRERIQQLADQVARWNDDEYVTAQARSRLQLVRAGERVYVIGVEPPASSDAGAEVKGPWYQQLWSSVQTADDPPTP
jgi:cell division protein FtsB